MAVGFAVICEAPLRDKREDRYGQHTSARTAEIAMYKSNQIKSNQTKPNQTIKQIPEVLRREHLQDT